MKATMKDNSGQPKNRQIALGGYSAGLLGRTGSTILELVEAVRHSESNILLQSVIEPLAPEILTRFSDKHFVKSSVILFQGDNLS